MAGADIILLMVRIDHRGIQGGMAEHLLDMLHRGAVVEGRGGERVAEDVRRDGDGQADAVTDLPDFLFQRLAGDMSVRGAGFAEKSL